MHPLPSALMIELLTWLDGREHSCGEALEAWAGRAGKALAAARPPVRSDDRFDGGKRAERRKGVRWLADLCRSCR